MQFDTSKGLAQLPIMLLRPAKPTRNVRVGEPLIRWVTHLLDKKIVEFIKQRNAELCEFKQS